MLRHAILAACLCLAPGFTLAQPPTPVVRDPDAVIVDELVVTARDRGPAWWRVSRGDNVVYVLGAPGLMPTGAQWDTAALDRHLKGANLLIAPFNKMGVGVLSAPKLMFAYAGLRRTSFEPQLSPALDVRFQGAAAKIGQPLSRYHLNNGVIAAVLMANDGRKAFGLSASELGDEIVRRARAQNIKVQSEIFALEPVFSAARDASLETQKACVEEATIEVERGPGPAREAAAAWAIGDVRGALATPRSFEQCLAEALGAADPSVRIKADTVAALRAALQRPGHAVAVVPLRALVARDGVLARLRAEGFEIETPDQV